MSAEILTPNCPACGAPPLMGLMLGDGTQAFCSGGDACPVLLWDPSKTAEENLDGAKFVRLEDNRPKDPS